TRARRRAAAQVAGAPSRLLDDEEPRGYVPGLELQLPEAVEAPGGDVAEVERGAPVAAHRTRALHQRGEVIEVVDLAPAHVVGEARGEGRLAEALRRRDAQPPAVAPGAAAAHRRVKLVEERVVDGGQRARVVPLDPDRDAEARIAVRVVGRAVERVDHPAPRGPGPVAAAALLGDDR